MLVLYESGSYRVLLEGYAVVVVNGERKRSVVLQLPESVSEDMARMLRGKGLDPERYRCVGSVLIRKEAEEAVRHAQPEAWAVERNELETLLIAAARDKEPQSIAAAESAFQKYERGFPGRASEMVACKFMLEKAKS